MNQQDNVKMKKALLEAEQRRTSAEIAMGDANATGDGAAYQRAYAAYDQALRDIDVIMVQIGLKGAEHE